MITFKTLSALDQFPLVHANLRAMFLDILSAWPTDRDLIVTRIADRDPNQRTEIHTSGPPWRALDISIHFVPEQTADRVVAQIQAKWDYDPARPGKYRPCYIHDAGSGSHIHLQCHPNSKRRGE